MSTGEVYVSVIIPVYNGAKYLKKCLKSVLSQTLEELEIICINDGSIDDSGVILDEYARAYPEKLKVFHTKNQGVWKARELGIEKAQGMYVGFVDCDDFIEAHMYETMWTLALREKADMVVTAYYRIIKSNGRQSMTVEMDTWGNKAWKVNKDLYKFPFLNTALWNKIIRREIMEKHVKFHTPPRVAEDALLLLSVYPCIHCVAFSTLPLYCYYVRNNTAMSYVKLNEIENILENFVKTKKYVKGITHAEEWESVIEIAAYIHLGVSLLLRCRLNESREYIKKVRIFFKEEFPQSNVYMRNFKDNKLLKIKLVQIAYMTKLIRFIPYLKKGLIKWIRW